MNCTLLFYYKPGLLTKDVNIVLTFDSPIKSEVSTDRNSVAWGVINLKAKPGSVASNQFTVDCPGRLGFSVVQPITFNTISSSSMVEMEYGQSVDLNLEGSTPTWSDPYNGTDPTSIRVTNKTVLAQNIAVGERESQPFGPQKYEEVLTKSPSQGTVKDVAGGFSTLVPTFMWKLGTNQTAEAKFRPVLNMYVNLDCQQNDLIAFDMQSITPVWTGDLAALAPLASFAFSETPQRGYAVTPIAAPVRL
ncbi:hypothetical protein PQX77_000574 [Marasmius sp. AFHP31]|nr:hypothetical protein PQX77_000574 [Marasmius sp. AFHP31]